MMVRLNVILMHKGVKIHLEVVVMKFLRWGIPIMC